MADSIDRKKRSWVMRQIRSRHNKSTELKFVEILKDKSITGWRRNYPLVGSPDFAFPKNRVAVFVDGCFWHGCPKHCRMPSSNRKYWKKKIEENMQRDKRTDRQLRARGWKPMRFWEHDLKSTTLNSRKLKRLSAIVMH